MRPGKTGSQTRSWLQLLVLTTLIVSGGAYAAPKTSEFETGADNQLGLTFAPDGSTAFWVAWDGAWGSGEASPRRIFTSRLKGGVWSAPAPVEFSGDHSDNDPSVSPDGRWLYFVSDRPSSDNDQVSDGNIWRYNLVEENRLEYLSINSGAAEYSPILTASGTLYFASDRDGGLGQGDLYRVEPMGDGFGTPELLGTAFNTPTGEWNLWVSPDESEVVFEASSRPTNISIPGDLYYSWRSLAGWAPAIPIEQLNSRNSDLMPRLHPDGETLYYTTAEIGGHARLVSIAWEPLREQLRHIIMTIIDDETVDEK